LGTLLIKAHRLVSGLAILFVSIYFAETPHGLFWTLTEITLSIALLMYMAETLFMSIIAILNYRKVDVIYPIVMLLSSVFALKALYTTTYIPALIVVTIMFISSYIAVPLKPQESQPSKGGDSEKEKGEKK